MFSELAERIHLKLRTVLVLGMAAFFAMSAMAVFADEGDRQQKRHHRGRPPVTVTVGDHTGISVVITGDHNVVQFIMNSQGTGVRETAIASSAKNDCNGRMQAYYARTNDWLAEMDR